MVTPAVLRPTAQYIQAESKQASGLGHFASSFCIIACPSSLFDLAARKTEVDELTEPLTNWFQQHDKRGFKRQNRVNSRQEKMHFQPADALASWSS